MDKKINNKDALFGKTISELEHIVNSLKLPAYTAKQIALWLYKKKIATIDEMTNLSKTARKSLAERYCLGISEPLSVKTSSDGTKKYLFPAINNAFIETAFIPEEKRDTLCVSSQVGCKMACTFCMTGKQGFQGHLSAGEILNQLRSIPESNNISNIVFMGMGEPFDNLTSVLKALEILTSDYGFEMSPKRINVSTIGILESLKMFLEKSKCNLAISLHTPFTDERKELMPIEKNQPIKEILSEIKKWDFARNRRVSFEYIMFKGVNDTPKHVSELAKILNGIKCRINLIRFHHVPGLEIIGSDDETIMNFQQQLKEKGIVTTIRASRGLDIEAACGLLSTKAILNQQKTILDVKK
ncbi:MAG: 23S rRNA (adenine(2503)-C(2))-methyltransferase [Bacteroidetes bacterium 4572_117]|nr:MAG: 23S rRNA (adenine(2503)-C(2))-methyltransferase [Bacteroidetes bacterium 4572_117]